MYCFRPFPGMLGKGVVLENKKGQPSFPDCPKKGTKKGTISLYRTLCRKKIRLPLYQVEHFITLSNRPALCLEDRLPLYQTQLFCAFGQPRWLFNLIARNSLALSSGED